jgi:hypothetical protein
MTNYLVKNNDDSEAEVTSTKASGAQVHLLDEGPTIGLKYGYSGEVGTGVNYVVDNGPSLGIGRSHT